MPDRTLLCGEATGVARQSTIAADAPPAVRVARKRELTDAHICSGALAALRFDLKSAQLSIGCRVPVPPSITV
jgi:hypothetical protein